MDWTMMQSAEDFDARLLQELEGYEWLLQTPFRRDWKSWTVSCPFPDHEDAKPSFSVYLWHGHLMWKCHGKCGTSGTLFDLADALGVTLPWTQASLHAPVQAIALGPDPVFDPQAFVTWAHTQLLASPDMLEWLAKERCINEAVVREMQLGLDVEKRLIFPAYDAAGELVGLHAHGWYPKRHQVLSAKTALLGLDAVAVARRQRKPVLICEGQADCCAARSAGWYAVGAPGANTWKPEWTDAFFGVDVVIVYDHDLAGERGGHKVARWLYDVAASVRVLLWPDDYPPHCDVTEVLRREGTARLKRLLGSALTYAPPTVAAQGDTIDWAAVSHGRIPLALLRDERLLPVDAKVYAALQVYGPWGYPSHARLAEMVSCHIASIKRSIERLEATGWVRVSRGWSGKKRRRNCYLTMGSI